MKRFTGALTILGAVILAAVTLQSQPFTVADQRGERPHAMTAGEVNAERIEQWLLVAEDIDPDKGRQLREMCHHDPEAFYQMMQRTGRRIISLADLKDSDPDLYETKISELRIEAQMETAAEQLADALRSGDEDAITAAEEELRRWVRTQVLYSIRARGDYLLRLKEHMERLEEELAFEAANFEQTVDRRFEEITARSRTQAAR